MGKGGREFFLSRYKELGHDLTGDEKTFSALRVNTLKVDECELTASLIRRGIELREIEFLDQGYEIISSPFSLGASFEYLLGQFYLQEPAAQFPAKILSPESKDAVLDMAAAPGGKTTQLASYMQNRGNLIAVDVSRERLYSLENNLERMGVVNCLVFNSDILTLDFHGVKFSKILLDAPCSGNYVTDPEWFMKRSFEDVERNSLLQRKMLRRALEILEPGGTLVYSTCSLEPEENEFNIHWLLKNHDISLGKIRGPGSNSPTNIFGVELDPELSSCHRFWPDETSTQGFFVAEVKLE
ncbi:NOL1/NOP2/sun family putative RNA methylase [Candidatus Bathyarchaeota archaeon]|nr:NOL1/NOP2/sun family putative RNA methylase [Candidatus Bathyarchaeota archaeon]